MRFNIRNSWRLVAAIAVVGIGAAFGASPAAAVQDIGSLSTPAPASWQSLPVEEQLPTSSPLSPLNNYIQFSSAGYRVNAPVDVLEQVPAQTLQQLQMLIGETNAAVESKKLIVNSDATASDSSASSSVSLRATWRGSHGFIKTHWYGLEIHLDAYAANKVIGGLWTGSGSAALVAALGGGPWAAPVAAALGASAGVLQLCQARDYSVTVYFLTLSLPLATAVCNPFA